MMSANVSRRNMLLRIAQRNAKEYNAVVSEINKIVGRTITADEMNQLVSLCDNFSWRSQRVETTWNTYIDFCDNHNYKTVEIEYAL